MKIGTTLDALNFSLAGAREGFGPFLGVYLQQQGFDPGVTGIAMGLAGVAGLLATAPIGALVDRTRAKRAALALAAGGIAVGAFLLIATKSIWLIAAAQLLIGLCDTSIAPLVAALTLGIVGQAAYGTRVARNEAFNHGGNAVNAALASVLGFLFGLGYVAIAIAVKSVAAIAVVFRVDPKAIDHETASGGKTREGAGLAALFKNRPLLVLAGSTLAFETANGAMLPFLAQARTAAGANPAITTGVMTVVSQAAMVVASLLAVRLARGRGHAGVLSAALLIVAGRGILAAFATSWWLVIPVQVLEGISMGLGGVAIPALVAEIMEGTGQANAGLGGVMTAYGAGAALSPILAGFLAQALGFGASFVGLSAVAGVGLVWWVVGRRLVGDRPAAAATSGAG